MDADEIVTRTTYPESWFLVDLVLPACPRQDPHWWGHRNTQQCDYNLVLNVPLILPFYFSQTTSTTKTAALQDSITSWEIIGISLSRAHGKKIVHLQICCCSTVINVFAHFPLTSRHLCGWSSGRHCQEKLLPRPQASILCCRWRTAGNKGHPPQLQPWWHHCECMLLSCPIQILNSATKYEIVNQKHGNLSSLTRALPLSWL